MTVVQFGFNESWPEDRAAKSRSALIDLVGQVQRSTAKFDFTRIAVHAQ